MIVFYIALAGACGALARWGFSVGVLKLAGPGFPLGTLGENLIGCFLIGALLRWAELRPLLVSAELRTVLAVGFIGTFTTFSTFEYESFALARGGQYWTAGINLVGSVVAGFVMVGVGIAAANGLSHLRALARA